MLARLNHPSIVAEHDFGESGGCYYLLMEFVDGLNLRQAMRVGRFMTEQALKVVPDMCAALRAAHGLGGSIATSIRRTSCSTQKAG
jgi:serine/threonine protein kinase